MLLKVPFDKCNIIQEEDLVLEEILKKDELRICNGFVDQYIIDENNRLTGVISSFDFKSGQAINSAEEIINRNPIRIQKNKYECDMVDALFKEATRLKSVPIVNEENVLLYIYQKVNKNEKRFVHENELRYSAVFFKNILSKIAELEKKEGKKIYLLTDLTQYTECNEKELFKYMININNLDELDREEALIVLAFFYDYNGKFAVRECVNRRIKFISYNFTNRDVIAFATSYFKIDKIAHETLLDEAYLNGFYFDLFDFQNIFQMLNMTRALDGDYVEIGTYRGDSARATLSYMSKAGINKKAYFLDTYEGFTYDSAKESSDCSWNGTHTDTSIGLVNYRLSEFSKNIEYRIVKSNIISEELPKDIQKISVCNIDLDIMEAVEAALDKVDKYVVRGGVIIAEDYGHTPDLIGAQFAVDNFYCKNIERYYGLYLQSGQFLLIKK